MGKYKKIPLEVSLYVRMLHQELGIKGMELAKRFQNTLKELFTGMQNYPLGKLKMVERKTKADHACCQIAVLDTLLIQ